MSWGDLKANPVKLLQLYFDIFVYVSNWGTHRLGLRIPSDAFDCKSFEPYLIGDQSLSITASGYVVIDLQSDVEYSEDWEERRGWMATLAPVRSDLLRGDLRPLYISWLACIQDGDINDDALEPPVPVCFANSLRLAEYLRVNKHLLEVAANASEDEDQTSDSVLRNGSHRCLQKNRIDCV